MEAEKQDASHSSKLGAKNKTHKKTTQTEKRPSEGFAGPRGIPYLPCVKKDTSTAKDEKHHSPDPTTSQSYLLQTQKKTTQTRRANDKLRHANAQAEKTTQSPDASVQIFCCRKRGLSLRIKATEGWRQTYVAC